MCREHVPSSSDELRRLLQSTGWQVVKKTKHWQATLPGTSAALTWGRRITRDGIRHLMADKRRIEKEMARVAA